MLTGKINYTPGSISFAEGFNGPKGDVGFFMEADFAKAVKIVNKIAKENPDIWVEMGLDGDWDCNSMTIYRNGEFTEYDRYHRSQWATPIIIVHYKDKTETYEVWTREEKEKPELTTIEGPGPLNPIGSPKIDWTKPVETQRGQKVHIYAIDHNLKHPVIGKIIDNNELYTWAYDGKFSLQIGRETPLDLRNVPEEK